LGVGLIEGSLSDFEGRVRGRRVCLNVDPKLFCSLLHIPYCRLLSQFVCFALLFDFTRSLETYREIIFLESRTFHRDGEVMACSFSRRYPLGEHPIRGSFSRDPAAMGFYALCGAARPSQEYWLLLPPWQLPAK